ncbi:MAG: hypothetical protein U1D97_05385 [Desulfuromonadales bacterium]|nr:hypothetical protein [Desulfuromonadales bacterium]
MAIVIHVAIVKESDYAEFAPLSIPSIVVDDYATFLKKTEEYCEELKAQGITPIKTNVDPAALKVWLRGAIATRGDLARYAAIISKS